MRRKLAGILLGLLAGVGGILAVRTATTERTANTAIALDGWEDTFDECLRMQPESRASACLQESSAKAAGLGDIGPALAILRLGLERNATLAGKCHAAVHTVGQEAIANGIGLYDAYKIPFIDCRFGFYHGALEAHTRDLDLAELERQMPDLCQPFGDDTQPASGECAHVLGHFIFDRVLPDIDGGFTICGILESRRLQARCSDGVMMQSIDLMRPAVNDPSHERYQLIETIWGTTRDQQLEAANSICEAAKSPEASYICNTNIPQALSVLWGAQDYQYLHTFCGQRQQDDWKQACFEGIAASGFTAFDWDEAAIVDACHASDDPNTKYCVGTLAFTYVLYTDEQRSRAICNLARDYELALCLQRVDEALATQSSISGTIDSLGETDYDIYSQ